MRRLNMILMLTLIVGPVFADMAPCGPELAKPAVGVLLKAYPIATERLPETGAMWVSLWGCIYKVGVAEITLAFPTSQGEQMPCKRKVMFGGIKDAHKGSDKR